MDIIENVNRLEDYLINDSEISLIDIQNISSYLANIRELAINYTQCSTQLKDKEEQTFSEWIEDNGYYLKDGNWFNRHGYSRNIDKLKKYHELNDCL